jgi:hypothetical protein
VATRRYADAGDGACPRAELSLMRLLTQPHWVAGSSPAMVNWWVSCAKQFKELLTLRHKPQHVIAQGGIAAKAVRQ